MPPSENAASSSPRRERLRTLAAYAGMVALTALTLFGISSAGERLTAAEPGNSGQGLGAQLPAMASETLLHVLLALLLIVAVSRLLGVLFRKFDQPAVVGEVIAGIALGPSLLGRVAPELSAYVLPNSVAPSLGVIAQVGVILFMFLVGVELDTSLLRKKAHTALAISHASIVAPFVLGAALSLWLYPKLSSADVPFSLFALFMGVAMSITAFPVLARILTDRGMQKSKLGVLALSCAAVDDVTAWCLLAFVVSLASTQAGGAALTVCLTFGYIALVCFGLRPWVQRYERAQALRGELGPNTMPLALCALIASSLITEWIGIHAIFGAFLLGSVVPHESLLATRLREKLEDLVVVLFLPAFFAFTGLRTEMGLLQTGEHWGMCAAIVGVACAGKFGGTYLAARFTGIDRYESASLGALMNTRGLMELVVLNIGLDLGVISPTLFAMMVVMAVLTTLGTAPLLSLFAWLSNRANGRPEGLARSKPAS